MSWLAERRESFGHAFRGLWTLLRSEPHARLHLLATLLVVSLGFSLGLERQDWQSLVLVVGLVWLAEGVNTALEYLADAAVPHHHPLVGKAKDVAAASVLLCAIIALIMALLIFWPYLVP